MEIVEILGYEVNHGNESIEVRFRMIEDSEGELRIDNIEMSEADDFGYVLISEDDFGFYQDEDDDYIEPADVNETELVSFLNEYYMVYPDRLPKKE
jgi:hypothetical protein